MSLKAIIEIMRYKNTNNKNKLMNKIHSFSIYLKINYYFMIYLQKYTYC